jgi:lysyl-tRNA synthetase, class II
MAQPIVRRVRPYLFHGFQRHQRLAARRGFAQAAVLHSKNGSGDEKAREVTGDYEKRVAQLQAYKPLAQCYPRLPNGFAKQRMSIGGFKEEYDRLTRDETEQDIVTIAGR